MSFLASLANPSWLLLALLLLALLLYLVILRNREARRISEKFPRERIVLTTFGVDYYGLESDAGGPSRSAGALVLLKDRLYYRARFGGRELTIPGAAITHIGVTDTHGGKALRQHALAVRFLNQAGRVEVAAFRVPLPAQWNAAIKATLIRDRAPHSAPEQTGAAREGE